MTLDYQDETKEKSLERIFTELATEGDMPYKAVTYIKSNPNHLDFDTSAALDTEISCMETAGEGGAWRIAVLALYEISKAKDESLSDFLNDKIFAGMKATTLKADKSDVEGFNKFMERYKKGLKIEASAIENLN